MVENVNRSGKKLWTSGSTTLLIGLVKQFDKEFQTGIKKYVWQKIANIISKDTSFDITAQQCDTKWKCLKDTYKNVKKHNDTSGNDIKEWEFYDDINEFLHKKPEITPEATCSSNLGLSVKGI